MGRLFDIVDEHRERQVYPPSYARIAEQVGVSRQTLLNWRGPSKLPDVEHLDGLARVTGVPYLRVLDAALHDTEYLPPPSTPSGEVKDDNVTDLSDRRSNLKPTTKRRSVAKSRPTKRRGDDDLEG